MHSVATGLVAVPGAVALLVLLVFDFGGGVMPARASRPERRAAYQPPPVVTVAGACTQPGGPPRRRLPLGRQGQRQPGAGAAERVTATTRRAPMVLLPAPVSASACARVSVTQVSALVRLDHPTLVPEQTGWPEPGCAGVIGLSLTRPLSGGGSRLPCGSFVLACCPLALSASRAPIAWSRG